MHLHTSGKRKCSLSPGTEEAPRRHGHAAVITWGPQNVAGHASAGQVWGACVHATLGLGCAVTRGQFIHRGSFCVG